MGQNLGHFKKVHIYNQRFIRKHSSLDNAGFHSASSEAWLHARAQNLGQFWGRRDLVWESKVYAWGLCASQGTLLVVSILIKNMVPLHLKRRIANIEVI